MTASTGRGRALGAGVTVWWCMAFLPCQRHWTGTEGFGSGALMVVLEAR